MNARIWAVKARQATAPLALLSADAKNAILLRMAASLDGSAHRTKLLKANETDLKQAKKSGLAPSVIARLALNEKKVSEIQNSIRTIAALPDPVRRLLGERLRPNGLNIYKVAVPIGVILIIYESRPNVTADCMALCLKSGNSVILKGGRETMRTNAVLFSILEKAALAAGLPQGAFQLADRGGRAGVSALLKMDDLIDLVIPRGGEGLIREVARLSRIPVIKHYKGICHVFVDRDADFQKANSIVVNAKVQNPAVCNAMETLLVDGKIAPRFLPEACALLARQGVELRGCPQTRRWVPGLKKAAEKDWATEYLDKILSIRVVKDVGEAIEHISRYGSKHSDAIVTENEATATRFSAAVDSACVFVNCSTRFSDGGQFGMGAEMGISTDKLHARGPMGLEELTSYKYVVRGQGQVRE